MVFFLVRSIILNPIIRDHVTSGFQVFNIQISIELLHLISQCIDTFHYSAAAASTQPVKDADIKTTAKSIELIRL